MKELVLGKEYALGVVFIPPRMMKDLNFRYRNKNEATDILSFPLSKKTGELYLCMAMVKKKAPQFNMTVREYLGYLFIHGLLHLEGHDHGRTMEKLERKYCRASKFPTPAYETSRTHTD